jgi:hypothetical protein
MIGDLTRAAEERHLLPNVRLIAASVGILLAGVIAQGRAQGTRGAVHERVTFPSGDGLHHPCCPAS